MKDIFKLLFNFKRESHIQTQQAALLEFINDSNNLNKAAEASMEKRIELIDRVLDGQPA